MDKCDCPDACNRTSYDVQLSHSALSGLALRSILQDKEKMAKEDFQETMDLQHRVDSVEFIDMLSKMKDVLNAISLFKNFIGTQTGHKLWFFQKAIKSVTIMTHLDLDLTLSQIKEHNHVYSTFMKQERDAIVKTFEKFTNSVEQFATSFKLEHPCGDMFATSSVTKADTLKQDFQDMRNMILSYKNLYSVNVRTQASCSNSSLFSLFPQYECAGFQWVEGKNIPTKAVIDEEAFEDCKKSWDNFERFEGNFSDIMSLFDVYLSDGNRYACEKARQAIQSSAESTTTYSGSGSGSGSGLGVTSTIAYTTLHTDYVSDTFSPNSGDSGDDDNSGDLASEGYITATMSTYNSQNATNTTITEANNSGDFSNITSTMSTHHSQSVHFTTVNTGTATTYSSALYTASSIASTETSNNYYSLSTELDQFGLTCKDILATVSICFNDYGNFLKQSLEDIENIKKESESLDTDSFDVTDLDEIESTANQTYHRYIANKVRKLDLANTLLAEGTTTTSSLSSLNDLISAYSNRFEQETIASTRSQLRQIKESLVHNYDIMVENFLALAEYMGYTIKGDQIKQLNLFRKPLPSVEDSEFVFFLRTESQVKRIIGNQPITFLKDKGKDLAKTALEAYFDSLFDDLDELHIRFVEVKGALVSAVADLKEALQTHRAELTLGPSFVR